MIGGNQIYSSLSLLARQSMLCSQNCQEWLQCLSYFSSLNTVKVILITCMMMPELRGITTVYATGSAFEKLVALNNHSFILEWELLVLLSTALRVGDIKYLILMLQICMVTVIVKGDVYCWKFNPCIN